eukprot:352342-Chlamydomonas_euryale.AAC.2
MYGRSPPCAVHRIWVRPARPRRAQCIRVQSATGSSATSWHRLVFRDHPAWVMSAARPGLPQAALCTCAWIRCLQSDVCVCVAASAKLKYPAYATAQGPSHRAHLSTPRMAALPSQRTAALPGHRVAARHALFTWGGAVLPKLRVRLLARRPPRRLHERPAELQQRVHDDRAGRRAHHIAHAAACASSLAPPARNAWLHLGGAYTMMEPVVERTTLRESSSSRSSVNASTG